MNSFKSLLIILISLFSTFALGQSKPPRPEIVVANSDSAAASLAYPLEKHFKNIRQLSFGGDNAEAYFSFDGKKITFQATNPKWGEQCDQIFIADWDQADMRNSKPSMISTGQGRTTCSYFMPGDTTIV
ncbi:MAG: hypothetical protein ACKPAD_09935, partial [Bacteroidota bacterium]